MVIYIRHTLQLYLHVRMYDIFLSYMLARHILQLGTKLKIYIYIYIYIYILHINNCRI